MYTVIVQHALSPDYERKETLLKGVAPLNKKERKKYFKEACICGYHIIQLPKGIDSGPTRLSFL